MAVTYSLYVPNVTHSVHTPPEVNNTQGGTGKQASSLWLPSSPTLLTVLAVDTLLTLLCTAVIAVCVVYMLKRRSQRREEKQKVGDVMQRYYWECEAQITQLLELLNKMKDTVIFRDVTELHLFGYMYRNRNIANDQCSPLRMSSCLTQQQRCENKEPRPFTPPAFNTQITIQKIERLFESLAIHLPCQGQCSPTLARVFTHHLCHIAQSSSILWSERTAAIIKCVIQYFAGRSAATRFASALMSDDELKSLVLARVPYASQLTLKVDHFILVEVNISNDCKIDMCNKIRYVDTVLANNDKLLQIKEKTVMETYYLAREICLKMNFIQNKTYFPDIVSKVGEDSKVWECVVYLRHLLRLMCIPKNIRKLENDDKFFQFLMQLYEALYTWSDTKVMLEVIERSRSNIFSYLRGLTVEQILMDKEFTKAKLEHVEKELHRHLNYLTVRQVQEENEKRHQLRRGENDPKMKSVDSDSSIYTMAMSTSSFHMRRQHSQDQQPESGCVSRDFDMAEHHRRDHQQASIDQTSLVSSSSIYATVASLTSVNEHAPLICRSPHTPHKQQTHISEMDRHQCSPSSEGSDLFETHV